MTRVTAEAFVEAWQTSDTLDEIVERTGLTHRHASSRASFYRKNGIPLKMFRRTHLDWETLAEIAKNPRGPK